MGQRCLRPLAYFRIAQLRRGHRSVRARAPAWCGAHEWRRRRDRAQRDPRPPRQTGRVTILETNEHVFAAPCEVRIITVPKVRPLARAPRRRALLSRTRRHAMTTTLSSLPLPPSIQLKLAAAGFTSVGDFDGLSATELAEDLAVEPREAQKLLAQVRSCLEVQPRDLKTKSALQLLNEERASNPITTFVKDLDNLLGGGVALGQLTGAWLCQGGGWRVAGGVRGGVRGARCARCARRAACAVLIVWVVPRVAPVLTAERRHRGRVRWRARGGQDAAGDAARCRRAHARGLRGAGYATLGSNPRRAGSLPGEPCPARGCSSRGCASPWAGGEAVYIDTEGSFLAERVAEMAKALRPRTYPAPTPHPGHRHTWTTDPSLDRDSSPDHGQP